jgi:hypothetical protein
MILTRRNLWPRYQYRYPNRGRAEGFCQSERDEAFRRERDCKCDGLDPSGFVLRHHLATLCYQNGRQHIIRSLTTR